MENRIKLAMADDHLLIRGGIRSLICGAHPDVVAVLEASDGMELLSMLADIDEALFPDVCMLDLNMPHMDGKETMELLARKYPLLRVLVCSLYKSEYSILKMLQLGAMGYIEKGVGDSTEYYNAIRTVYSGGYYHPDVPFLLTGSKPAMPHLNETEIRFLQHCVSGDPYKVIADKMGLSFRTVCSCRDHLLEKLGFHNRAELAAFALTTGIYIPKRST